MNHRDFIAVGSANAAAAARDAIDSRAGARCLRRRPVAALDGKPRRDVVRGRHRRAEGGLASRRGGRRRQDRRRRRHPCRDPQDFFAEAVQRSGHSGAPGPIAVGQVFLPQDRSRRAGALPADRRDRNPRTSATAIYGWRQVPIDVECIGEKANATRPEIEQIMIRNPRAGEAGPATRVRARPLRDPPPDREAGDRGADSGTLRLLAVVPLDHLQGHVPGREPDRVLSRPARRALRQPLRDLPPALFDQHLPDLAAGAAVPHAGATTARSTRSPATSTG